MKVINTGENMIIECSFAEMSHITESLKKYDDLGISMAEKMQNEQEVIRPEVSG